MVCFLGSNVVLVGALCSREESEVGQGPPQAQVIPHEEIRRQGLNNVSCSAKTEIKISFRKPFLSFHIIKNLTEESIVVFGKIYCYWLSYSTQI